MLKIFLRDLWSYFYFTTKNFFTLQFFKYFLEYNVIFFITLSEDKNIYDKTSY